MILATSDKHLVCQCNLCGWRRKETTLDGSEKRIRDHLAMMHGRDWYDDGGIVLVHYEEKGNGKVIQERNPIDGTKSTKFEFPTRIYRGNIDNKKFKKQPSYQEILANRQRDAWANYE